MVESSTAISAIGSGAEQVQILALSGSQRRGSYNTGLIEAASLRVPSAVRVTIGVGLDALPFFNEDVDNSGVPEIVRDFRAAIASADGLLIATPEYNSGIPGLLKNALDWASRPFGRSALSGKTVAIMGASPSPGGAASAQRELRSVLGRAGARVIEGPVLELARAHEHFDDQGTLVSAVGQGAVAKVVEALVAEARPASRVRVAA